MMRIPVTLKVMALVIGLTASYSYIGQMVPQDEVHPPKAMQIAKDIGTEEMVRIGEEIFVGKGKCSLCHTIGNTSTDHLRFPDLAGVGARAGTRVAGLDAASYLAQSLYEPDRFIVEGFSSGKRAVNKPPIDLTGDEILTVIAYLQSLGSEPTVTMSTRFSFGSAETDSTPASTEGTAPVPAPSAADQRAIENGKRLYNTTCVLCHGDQAQGNELFNAPRLAGQEVWYIERQLQNFASGRRGSDPTDVFGAQMRPMAIALNGNENIADVAAYLSSIPR